MTDVAAWLARLGLDRYAAAFAANDVDGAALRHLTDEDLKELGVSLGHRRILLAEIARLDAGPSAPAPPRDLSERREVTVLFADLSGYTALGRELDAEQLHAVVERVFAAADAAIERWGGTVDKHIGDCVMAVFGAPIAHADDPARAAAAAIEIRDAIPRIGEEIGRPLSVHLGIASGRVVASGVGQGRWRSYTVTGDSVNLASRLTDRAVSGEILISAAVATALAGRFEGAALQPFRVDGIEEDVRAWRLDRLLTSAERPRTAFVGRVLELAALRRRMEEVRSAGTGVTVVIRGEPGIGKTRLLERLAEEAAADGFRVHRAAVLDFGGGPGDAVGTIARGLLAQGEDPSTPEEWEAVLGEAVRGGLLDQEDEPFLRDLCGLALPARLAEAYGAMEEKRRVRGRERAFARLGIRAARRRPTLIAVEDLHWIEPASLDLFRALRGGTGSAPLILVLSTRPPGDALDLMKEGTHLVDLGPLDPAEAFSLARSLGAADRETMRRCVERAGGNPLFLDQLVRHALGDGSDGQDGAVPASVQSLVQERVDDLAPVDREAIQAASVLGQRVSVEAVAALLGLDRFDPTTLVRRGLLKDGGGGLMFAHALIRDGVYAMLLRDRRLSLHRAGAAWYAAEGDRTMRARHLQMADDPEAAVALMEAAAEALAGFRAEHALELVDGALAAAGDAATPLKVSMLLQKGEVLQTLSRTDEAMMAFLAALDAATTDEERARARLGLAEGLRIKDRPMEAFGLLDQAEPVAEAAGLHSLHARILNLRGNLLFPLGRTEDCYETHSRAVEAARRAQDPEMLARALGGLADAEFARSRIRSAHAGFAECIALARKLGLARTVAANGGMMAITSAMLGEFDDCLALAREAVEEARRIGHRRAEIIAHHAICFVQLWRLRADLARPHAEAADELARRIGAARFDPENKALIARVLAEEGRPAEALDLLRQAWDGAVATGVEYCGPMVLGLLALHSTDSDERRRALDEGLRLLATPGLAHNVVWFSTYGGEAALESGDVRTARRVYDLLEATTAVEPAGYTDMLIARGRALAAALSCDPGDEDQVARVSGALRQARDAFASLDLGWFLPALDRALGRLPRLASGAGAD